MIWDEKDLRIINGLQAGFPVCSRPFDQAGQRLNLSGQELIIRINRLLASGVFSRFAPLVNAERLGGGVTLVAMRLPSAEVERVATLINRLPQVSQNYGRDHPFNLWFVVATETKEQIAVVLDEIEHLTGYPVYPMPKKKEYRVGFRIALDGQGQVHTVPWQDNQPLERAVEAEDRAIIAAMQAGLPLVEQPYARLADQVGQSEEEVMQRVDKLLAAGVFRRLGGVPNHYRLGLKANGMTVWQVAEETIDVVGEKLAGLEFVTHCYHRPSPYPEWPYNLFAMVHGAERGQVLGKAAQMAQMLGDEVLGWEILFSTTVWKKTGLRLL